jgi:hypothetical protein
MARTPKAPKPADKSSAMILAHRLREAMVNDPDFAPDDVPSETGGVYEPGAMFHLETSDGRRFRVRVIRTS